MIESEKFLNSLNHRNPGRPYFAIETGMDAQLTIAYQGQFMRLPIAEILSFAQRWHTEQDHQREIGTKGTGLRRFPYALFGTNMNDPDASQVGLNAV